MIRKVSTSCTSSAYTTGMVVNGQLTIENVFNSNRLSPVLQSVIVNDTTTACPNLDLIFLDSAISTDVSTALGDAVEITLADADMDKIIGIVQITSFAHFANNMIGFATALALPVSPAYVPSDKNLYFIPVVRGTSPVDWTSLSFTFNFVE